MLNFNLLSVRIPFLIVVASLLFAAAVGYISAGKITEAYDNAEVEGCRAAAKSIQPLVMEKALKGDCDGIKKSVDELVKDSLVTGVAINITDLRMRCQHTIGDSVFEAKTKETLLIHDGDGVKIGDMTVAYSLGGVCETRQSEFYKIFALVTGGFFLILMIIFRSFILTMKPMKALTKEMEGFDPTRPSDEILYKAGQDEISMLVRSAGSMLEKLVAYAKRVNAASSNAIHSESHLKEAQRLAKIGSWEFDFENGHFDMSDEMFRILGINTANERVSWEQFLAFVAYEDQEYVYQVIDDAIARGTTFHMGYSLKLANGETVEVYTHGKVRRGAENSIRISGVTRDVTEQNRTQRMIERQTYYDGLTHLPNRVLLKDRLHKAIETARRSRSKVAVLLVDLDHFGLINETLGYRVGDKLLEYVATTLSHQLRGSDTVSRYTGDKFVALLPQLKGADDTSMVAKKLMDILDGQHVIDRHTLYVSASIGIAIFPDHAEEVDDLIRCADTAMYEAKQEGRKTWKLYDTLMAGRESRLTAFEEELKSAIAEKTDFELYYQPQILHANSRVGGAEALIRWHRGEELVSAEQFIPVLESSGMITELGYWMIDEAAKQIAVWQLAGRAVTIWINLSARQMQDPHLADEVKEIIARHGIKPELLGFEVSERVLLSNIEVYTSQLQRLKLQRVQLAMDDYGRNLSSVELLSRFPLDRLNIDSAFVHTLQADQDGDRSKIHALVAMAEILGLKTVIEGVENEYQEQMLASVPYGMIQGHLYSEPLSLEAFSELLDSQPE